MGEITGRKTIGRDIRLTFKEDEQDIREYLESKSSATCFLKDLARLEMQREKKILESSDATYVMQQLLEKLQMNAPVFNLTANIEGVVAPTNYPSNNSQLESTEEEEIEIDLDISDLI
ncbi:MAG: hypothetical protein ACRCX2_00305 [Paraclostridium sp.]